MRGTAAALLRCLAIAGYLAMIALQVVFVTPRGAEGATLRLSQVLSISADQGVCVLPVCLLGTPCVLGVSGGCVLPLTPPGPVARPRTPQAAPPAAAAAPPKPLAVAIRPAAAPTVAHHAAPARVAAAPVAPAPVLVIPVARPVVAASPVEHTPPLASGALPVPATVVTPSTALPTPSGAAWWLYVLFAAVDLAAGVALAVLIRRTAAARPRR